MWARSRTGKGGGNEGFDFHLSHLRPLEAEADGRAEEEWKAVACSELWGEVRAALRTAVRNHLFHWDGEEAEEVSVRERYSPRPKMRMEESRFEACWGS